MPSVRVRRNTAPVSALAPAERLPIQSTAIRGNSANQDANTRDRQNPADSVESINGKGDSRQDEVVLGPPLSVDNSKTAADAGQGEHMQQQRTLRLLTGEPGQVVQL